MQKFHIEGDPPLEDHFRIRYLEEGYQRNLAFLKCFGALRSESIHTSNFVSRLLAVLTSQIDDSPRSEAPVAHHWLQMTRAKYLLQYVYFCSPEVAKKELEKIEVMLRGESDLVAELKFANQKWQAVLDDLMLEIRTIRLLRSLGGLTGSDIAELDAIMDRMMADRQNSTGRPVLSVSAMINIATFLKDMPGKEKLRGIDSVVSRVITFEENRNEHFKYSNYSRDRMHALLAISVGYEIRSHFSSGVKERRYTDAGLASVNKLIRMTARRYDPMDFAAAHLVKHFLESRSVAVGRMRSVGVTSDSLRLSKEIVTNMGLLLFEQELGQIAQA